jgi:hypothetical protein
MKKMALLLGAALVAILVGSAREASAQERVKLKVTNLDDVGVFYWEADNDPLMTKGLQQDGEVDITDKIKAKPGGRLYMVLINRAGGYAWNAEIWQGGRMVYKDTVNRPQPDNRTESVGVVRQRVVELAFDHTGKVMAKDLTFTHGSTFINAR